MIGQCFEILANPNLTRRTTAARSVHECPDRADWIVRGGISFSYPTNTSFNVLHQTLFACSPRGSQVASEIFFWGKTPEIYLKKDERVVMANAEGVSVAVWYDEAVLGVFLETRCLRLHCESAPETCYANVQALCSQFPVMCRHINTKASADLTIERGN